MTSTTFKTNDWEQLADLALAGKRLTEQQALSVLRADDDELLPLLQAAYRVRRHFYGKRVKLNMIINAKSGLCPEDCGYCSQSIRSTASIEKYSLLDKETLVAGAREAMNRQAGTYCIVASGRRPSGRELEQVIEAVQEIRDTMPLKICACLGLLNAEQARQLADAGVHRYNHNLNTSRDHYEQITTTHTYEQREQTVQHVKQSGMSPCSGLIAGMGETDEQLVELCFALRELDADSIPVNFLNPIEGTPLENCTHTPAMRGLRILALLRLTCPSKEIRVAGGRELNLRTLQPLALYAANSIFVGDYLTTPGQEAALDYQMIEDLGFEIEHNALTGDVPPVLHT